MNEAGQLEWLLECLIHVIARAAIKVEEVRQIVGDGTKQIRAYNLCDGSLGLTAVAKKTGLDQGNLSRSVDRWVKNGVMFRLGEGREARPLHIYPIPQKGSRQSRTKGSRKQR